MRKVIAFIVCMSLLTTVLAACSNSNNKPTVTKSGQPATTTPSAKPTQTVHPVKTVEPVKTVAPTPQTTSDATDAPDAKKIKVYSTSSEIKQILEKFKELHPDFPYELDINTFELIDLDVEKYSVEEIRKNSSDAPDLFISNSINMYNFTQGNWGDCVSSYEDLGLNTDALVKEAEVEKYNVEFGTRQDGKLIGLSYNNGAGAFHYRRSIAKAVWGTDEPTVIQKKIGGSWDNFLSAAKELKKKGYAIVAGYDELWSMIACSAKEAWVVDGKLTIDPKRQEYLDIAKTMTENKYAIGAQRWREEWFDGMKKDSKVFGYFGPWWLSTNTIPGWYKVAEKGQDTAGDWAVCKPTCNFVHLNDYLLVSANCKVKKAVGEIINWMYFDTGKTGLQYILAKEGLGAGGKQVATSKRVLDQVDGSNDFLGGQNLYKVYASLSKEGTVANLCKYDQYIEPYFEKQVKLYVEGKKAKEKALADFKREVKKVYGREFVVD